MLLNFRDTAKELDIGQRNFINLLLMKGYVYRDDLGKLYPYRVYVPKLFVVKKFERNGKTILQPLITPKGREVFKDLIQLSA